VSLSAGRLQPAEETVLLVVDAGSEVEERVKPEQIGGVGTESQAPQLLDDQGRAVGRSERAAEGAAAGIKDIDLPIAKVADEQLAAEGAEVRRREGQTPR
jgi:hypothetical protein